jgi:hypothetical protein
MTELERVLETLSNAPKTGTEELGKFLEELRELKRAGVPVLTDPEFEHVDLTRKRKEISNPIFARIAI